MKRIAALACSIMLMGSISSCNKFLDTKPQDFSNPEFFYRTEAELNYALAATYSPLGDASIYGQRILRSGLDAEDGFYLSSTDVEGPHYYENEPANSYIRNWWKTCYLGIERANLLLANINKPDMDETKRGIIEGETRFLRGYYYFLLAMNYGGVPLLLEPTGELKTTSIPRAPLADVYKQIVSDMEFAETKVLDASAVGFGGRINKSAVRGILARVNLYWAGAPVKDISRYAEARKWAEMVKNDPAHQLLTDYGQVFINYGADKYDIRESIWEVEFFGNTQGAWREAGAIGTYFGPRYTANMPDADPNQGYQYGSLVSSGILWDKYDSPLSLGSYDRRRDFAIIPYTLSNKKLGEGVYVAEKKPYTTISKYSRSTGKYRREWEVVMPKEKNYSPMNFPILRFSDVLLMFAEADFMEKGVVTPEAIAAVNHVRRRGYGKYLNGIVGVSESIKSIPILDGGSNYASTPTVTITGGIDPSKGGMNATAKAVRSSSTKKITSITIVDPGQGYSSVADIEIAITGGEATSGTPTVIAKAGTPVLTTLTDADLPVALTAPDKFLQAIRDERSRELCFEGLRKYDLMRWDIFYETIKSAYNDVVEVGGSSAAKRAYGSARPRDVIWPIPAYDMGLNSALVQNLGW